jgi:transcriptional regulator with XRE-family HTH domain
MVKMLYPEIAKYLNDEWLKFFMKRGGRVSQADFAAHLGLSEANLSRYMKGAQRPTPPNQDAIASALGPKIYEVMGVPKRMPKDQALAEMASDWHILTNDERKSLLEEFRAKVERHRQSNHQAFQEG